MQQEAVGNSFSGPGPAGAVINYAHVSAVGGNGNVGGSAGSVIMNTQQQQVFGTSFEIISNVGRVDLTGGTTNAAFIFGGTGGSLNFNGISGVQNSGAINVSSGNGPSSNGDAENANGMSLIGTAGPVQNNGALTANGGTGGSDAGGGGSILLQGTLVTNSGTISCAGGASTSFGGAGGGIILNSEPDGPTNNTGTLSVVAGSGAGDGGTGTITIDGVIEN